MWFINFTYISDLIYYARIVMDNIYVEIVQLFKNMILQIKFIFLMRLVV